MNDSLPRTLESAVFSPCRTWRYVLARDTGIIVKGQNVGLLFPPTAVFIGLNPSTADECINSDTRVQCSDCAR